MTDLQKQIELLMNQHPEIFKTEADFWSFLRGCLRRGIWEKSPMKLKHHKSTKIPPPEEYTGRGKVGHICALSGEWVMTSKAEVDHKKGHVSLKSEEDIIPFIIHMLGSGDQLQMVDKELHKIKSYAERMGISYEEAKDQKKVIKMIKDFGVKQVKDLLDKHGLKNNNNEVRREGLLRLIREGKI